MSEVAGLEMRVDSSQAAKAADVLDTLAAKGAKAEKATQGLEDEIGDLTGKLFPATKGLADCARLSQLVAEKFNKGEINAKEYGEAIGRIKLKQDQLNASLMATDPAAQKASGGLNSMLGIVKNLAIGYAAYRAASAVLTATTESENAQAQLAAVIKATGGAAGVSQKALNEYAAAMSQLTKFDDEAINGAQSMLLTFREIGSTVFPQATEAVMDMATTMGGDLNGAAMQLGKALNDPVEGLAALGRVGIKFTDDQKALIERLVETNDVASAQKIILKEVADEMGGTARAARDTLGGAIAVLKTNFGNLLEGDASGPGVQGAKEGINDFADTLNSAEVKEGFNTILEGLAKLAKYASYAAVAINGVRDAYRDVADKSMTGLLSRQTEITDLINSKGLMDRAVALFNSDIYDSFSTAEGLRTELNAINAELGKRKVEADYNNPDNINTPGGRIEFIDPPSRSLDPEGEAERARLRKEAEADAKRASSAAQNAAEAEVKRRQAAFNSLRDSLRTEEEAIADSYATRQKIILQSTSAGNERDELMSRLDAENALKLQKLAESQGAELEGVRLSLRTQEQVIAESYAKRQAIVDASTVAGSEARANMSAQLLAERDADLAELEMRKQLQVDSLMDGLRTEEEELRLSYERRRDMILKSTIGTETDRTNAALELQRQYNADAERLEYERQGQTLSNAETIAGSLAAIAKGTLGEQSKAYKALFAISKAFAIAQSILKIQEAYANALAAKTMGEKIAQYAIIASQGAQIISTISSASFSGAHDEGGRIPAGKIGIVGEYGPEFVRGPAAVTGRQLTARAMSGASSGGDINFSTQITIDASGNSGTQTSGGGADKNARELNELVTTKVRDILSFEQRQGGILWKMQNGQ